MYYFTSNEWIDKIKKNKKYVFCNQRWWYDKHNEIWSKIKEALNVKFHSMPVYDENT